MGEAHTCGFPDEACSTCEADVDTCPGVETDPNPCRCPCYGCKHHCGAHNPVHVDNTDVYNCPGCRGVRPCGHSGDYTGDDCTYNVRCRCRSGTADGCCQHRG